MLEHTKKRHTEAVELKFLGPVHNRDKAVTALRDLGFVDVSDSIPWREAFPEYEDKDIPGVCLSGARAREEMTQRQLSELTGIPQRHISEMENGKRPIGKKTARVLGEALNISYKVFL